MVMARTQEPGVESALCHELGPRLVRQPAGAPEVVRVRVRDYDSVNVTNFEAGRSQACCESGPGRLAGHAGVDDGSAAIVEEGIAVHVSQPGEENRHLEAEDARCDFDDLF